MVGIFLQIKLLKHESANRLPKYLLKIQVLIQDVRD